MTGPVPIAQVVQALDLALVERQRWFRHKGRASAGFEVVDGWPVMYGGSFHGWWLLLRVPLDTVSTLYQMPVVLSDDPDTPLPRLGELAWAGRTCFVYDGGCDTIMVSDLVARIQQRRTFPVKKGIVQPETFDSTSLLSARVDFVEPNSSNTICRLNGRLLFKLYRCLDEAGRREADLLSALARQGIGGIPSVKAVVSYSGGDGALLALALVQEWVSEGEDAWRWLTGVLLRGPQPLDAEIECMAEAVTAIHRGLIGIGSRSWTEHDTRSLKGRIREQIARLHELKGGETSSPLRGDLEAALSRMELIEVGEPGVASPVHGDLHLGQMLRQRDRYLILDFEGEPLASPEARLAWHSPLKDVAGMLRSFDYAAAYARRQGAPGTTDEWERWERRAETVFLEAYGHRMCETLGLRAEACAGLLSLYLLEKATYEIGYELQSRPDWVDIPLNGLRRVLRYT